MKIKARIVENERTGQSDFDTETSYGLEINGRIITWFGHENAFMHDSLKEEKRKEVEMFREIVKRINEGNKS